MFKISPGPIIYILSILYLDKSLLFLTIKLLLFIVSAFSKGKLKWWPTSHLHDEISAADLNVLLYQGNPEFASIGKPFKKVRS